jgi:hypothetical protein
MKLDTRPTLGRKEQTSSDLSLGPSCVPVPVRAACVLMLLTKKNSGLRVRVTGQG